jgi:hypothetical protein
MAERLAELSDLPEEFDSVPSNVRLRFLNLAEKFVSLKRMGEDTSEMHWLRAAHWLHSAGLGTGAGMGGPVASKSVGDVSVSYAVSPASFVGSDLGSTIYGRQLLALQRLYAGMGVGVA